ncbi:MAG: hypothetical protein DRH51_00130 [Candidatus Coatesbacteria bacterium]|nr:MAG: hypothetical protein DRH51_00130 [Candidatus Coatesbacteria bacterium]
MTRLISPFIFIAILLILFGCGRGKDTTDVTTQDRTDTTEVNEGPKMPSFTITGIDGSKVTSEQFEGKVLIIDFWATWCKPCVFSIPHLIEIKDEYEGDDFDVLGISLDRGPNAIEKVKEFASQLGINYTVAMGNQDVANAFGGIPAIPTMFLIDQDGNIVKKWVGFGPGTGEEISTEVEALLSSGS